MKIADTNHLDMLRWLQKSLWHVCDKLVCVTEMEFSLWQSMGRFVTKSVYTYHERARTSSQIQHRGIWALLQNRHIMLFIDACNSEHQFLIFLVNSSANHHQLTFTKGFTW